MFQSTLQSLTCAELCNPDLNPISFCMTAPLPSLRLGTSAAGRWPRAMACLLFTLAVLRAGISVDETGKQHYLDATIAFKRAVLNCIDYLSKFGYTKRQARPAALHPGVPSAHAGCVGRRDI